MTNKIITKTNKELVSEFLNTLPPRIKVSSRVIGQRVSLTRNQVTVALSGLVDKDCVDIDRDSTANNLYSIRHYTLDLNYLFFATSPLLSE